MTQIRRAATTDVPALARLYVEFHNFHARGVPARLSPVGPPNEELRDALTQILANEKAAVFVAEEGGEVAGFVEVAHAWAREQGATEVELEIWEFEAGPLRFYESLGYRTVKRRLTLSV